MKILQKLFLLFFWAITLFSQSFQIKVVSKSSLTEGVVHKKLLESKTPLTINLLEIDLTNPNLDITSVTAFDSVAGNQKVSSMVKARKNQNIIAAINADFYEKGGSSTNAFIADGHFVSMPIKAFSTIGFDKSNKPFINKISFAANLYINGQTKKINGVNKVRDTNELILYNKFTGSSTATNQWGIEIELHQINKQSVNDTLYFVAGKKQKLKGNMKIKNGYSVLSGHDTGADFINEFVETGDTVRALVGVKGMPPSLDDLVGGFTQLVTKGKNSAIESYDKVGKNRDYFALGLHPRTAIGFNKSKTKLYMVTVDGRRVSSLGINLPDLAGLMIYFGSYEALNLDGGGSTTMIVNGKVVNTPSDANGERAVANALMVRLKKH